MRTRTFVHVFTICVRSVCWHCAHCVWRTGGARIGRPQQHAMSGATNGEAALGITCDGQTRLEDIERQVIIATLRSNNGHRQRSAAALGIGVRTLGLKLKKWKEMII